MANFIDFFRFLLDFFGFCVDFGRILGRFGEEFSMIFHIFSENADLQKYCAHAVFYRGRAFKKMQNSLKKRIPNQHKFYMRKNGSKSALKIEFDQSWAPFGKVWGRLGPSFGHSWAQNLVFKSILKVCKNPVLPVRCNSRKLIGFTTGRGPARR